MGEDIDPSIDIIVRVLIDGGSKVNIVTLPISRQLGWIDIQPAPFYIQMAYQSHVQPIGLIKDISTKIQDAPFKVMFVVIELIVNSNNYNLLLGLNFKKGHKKYFIPLEEKQHYPKAQLPSIVEPPHMMVGLEEGKDFQFLEANRDLWPVQLIDIPEVLSKFHQNILTTIVQLESEHLQFEGETSWLSNEDVFTQTSVHS
ncbi:hypothetical protein KP509_18G038900 [Ceratopteris richardii]|uniref:Uncharacterized protein n=1 Tax=Ceratopteris richardii TaxID=49495 RepID=A0A8T2SSL3_CERRI|nr:hypothetical protein KP509_18G038900 [Ceratopteris richardii]